MRLLHAICSLLLAPALALCQSADPSKPSNSDKESATVAGQVLRSDTGDPLKKAQVSLQARSADGFSAFRLTDEQGHFSFDKVPAGSYELHLSRNGFVDAEYGQKKPGAPGAVLTISAGQRLTDLVFKLIRNASISGHVYDEDGEPVSHAEVIVYRASRQAGKEERTSYDPVSTNDLGEFRVYDLTPGRYFIAVNYRLESRAPERRVAEREEFNPGYLPAYYPNTSDSGKAVPLTVGPGDEVRSIDFMLRPGHLVTVSGRVINTVPAPPHASGGVHLASQASGLADVGAQNLYTSFELKDGHFVIHNVPPGSYTLNAIWADRDTREMHRARRWLDVGSTDIEGLTLTIVPGVNVPGRVVWEGTPAVDARDLTVWLRPVEENDVYFQQQTPKADGSFVLKSISEGTYRPRVALQARDANFYLKSARYGTLSIPESGFAIQAGSDLPLEITLCARAAEVNGIVLTSDSLPAAGVTVVLIPEADRRSFKDFYKTSTTDQNGKFSMKGIAPGDYKLFSWESVEGNEWTDADWYDAAWLKPYETKGESIHLEESDHKSVNLNLIETKLDSSPAN